MEGISGQLKTLSSPKCTVQTVFTTTIPAAVWKAFKM